MCESSEMFCVDHFSFTYTFRDSSPNDVGLGLLQFHVSILKIVYQSSPHLSANDTCTSLECSLLLINYCSCSLINIF